MGVFVLGVQGAIRMAEWELQNGKNPQLLNTSHSIMTSQTQEIAEMQQYLAQLPIRADCASAPAPSPPSPVRSPYRSNMVPAWRNVSTQCMIIKWIRNCLVRE